MNPNSPRILTLSPRQCSPATSGAKLREMHLLRALGEWGELFLAGFEDAEAGAVRKTDLMFCRDYGYVSKPPSYRPSQMIRGVIGKWPLPILNYTSSTLVEAAERFADGRDFDLIQLESIHMIRGASALRARGVRAPVVYNWHNIESELMFRYAETVRSPARRLYAALTAHKLRRIEKEILRDALGHVVCSEREREMLSQIAPRARIAVIENGVDCEIGRAHV